MTVKVVRGLVQTVKPATLNKVGAGDGGTGSLAARAASANPQASEAAVTAVRSLRGSGNVEKIRDSSEARSVAKSVASGIFSNESEAKEAHSGLSSSSAQGIL